jgi:hypothetical protein
MNSFNKALQKLCNAIFKGFYLFAAFTFTVLLTILLINVISESFCQGGAWIFFILLTQILSLLLPE